MKVKVLKCYVDKYTKKFYNVGEETEITKERYNEIQGKGNFVQVLEETSKKATKKVTKKVTKKED
mgnify:CR=1 FL=1